MMGWNSFITQAQGAGVTTVRYLVDMKMLHVIDTKPVRAVRVVCSTIERGLLGVCVCVSVCQPSDR
jgi:hypothetical protein